MEHPPCFGKFFSASVEGCSSCKLMASCKSYVESVLGITYPAEYSQGIAADGAAILRDGAPMTPEEIVLSLNVAAALEAKLSAPKARADMAEELADRLKLAGDAIDELLHGRPVLGAMSLMLKLADTLAKYDALKEGE